MKRIVFLLAYSLILLISAFVFKALEAKEIELKYENSIFLTGPVDDNMERKFIADADRIITGGPKIINVVIQTDGGQQYISQNIADTLKKYSATNTINIISLKAYSGGYMIHQLSGGNRYAIENSTLMWHNPVYRGLSGSFVQIMVAMNQWAAELDVLLKNLHKRTNLTYEVFIQHMNASVYYDAKMALQFGIIDDIITVKCEKNFVQCDYVLIEQKANR